MSWPSATDAAAFLAMSQDVLATQPFSRLVGAELVAVEPSRCAQGKIARLASDAAA